MILLLKPPSSVENELDSSKDQASKTSKISITKLIAYQEKYTLIKLL